MFGGFPFAGAAFGFGQGTAGISGPHPTADYLIQIRADDGVMVPSADDVVVRVRPDEEVMSP